MESLPASPQPVLSIPHCRQINERTELAIALVMPGFHPSKKRDLLPGDNCGFLDSIDCQCVSRMDGSQKKRGIRTKYIVRTGLAPRMRHGKT